MSASPLPNKTTLVAHLKIVQKKHTNRSLDAAQTLSEQNSTSVKTVENPASSNGNDDDVTTVADSAAITSPTKAGKHVGDVLLESGNPNPLNI